MKTTPHLTGIIAAVAVALIFGSFLVAGHYLKSSTKESGKDQYLRGKQDGFDQAIRYAYAHKMIERADSLNGVTSITHCIFVKLEIQAPMLSISEITNCPDTTISFGYNNFWGEGIKFWPRDLLDTTNFYQP